MLLTASAPAAAQPVTWLIFVDDLHLDFRNTGRIRDLVRKIAKTLPVDGDLVAMYSCGPSGLTIAPTTDRRVVDVEARKVTGNGLKAEDILAGGPAGAREVRYRAGVARSRLLELVATADGDGRAVLIYISNGYSTGTPAPLPGHPSPKIFAIDPRLITGDPDPDRVTRPDHWTATRNSMREMAEASGGFVQEENESLDDALARIIQVIRQ
jgi:hypothetical protein